MGTVDKSTRDDFIEDLMRERDELLERIRQLEAERDQWQKQAMSNG